MIRLFRPLSLHMVSRFVALLLLLGACSSAETLEETGSSTAPASTATSSPTTSQQEPPVFHLFDSEGLDLEVFRDGLITAEKSVVDQMFSSAPLYEMDLVMKEDLTGISGAMSVRFVNDESGALGEVVFRLFPNISDGSVLVNGLAVDGSSVEPSYELDGSVMTVPLESPLQPGEHVIITMEIDVTAPIEEGGKYGTFLLDDEILAFSHFFPILAVYDDEGWNTEIPAPHGDSVFSDSGFFLVRLETPMNLTVVTSGQLVAKEVLPDSDNEARFYSAGPVRDFYLAASHRFEMIQVRVGETIINSFAPPEFAAQNQDVLASVEASVAMFNELYGSYPYTELDFVSTATLALGVEYPGVVAMAMGHYDPESGFDQPTIVSTVVHEVAHQWFYGTVGNDQLDEPWLDEAMAQYATWVYWRETQGEGGDEGFRTHLDSRWARVEYADIPIGLPADAYEGTEYGAIVYGRGPLFVDGLAKIVGQETFDEFLAEYAATFKYGIASTQGYQALLERHCGCDLSHEFEAAVYPR